MIDDDDDDGIWWYVWGHCSSRAVSGIRFVATFVVSSAAGSFAPLSAWSVD